ncbi:hypothetical protein AMK21_11705 [Streptomyces sp. CB00316]|nr:hypothetical protein AMK21_11705 [Streptomyces sp. CB00316]
MAGPSRNGPACFRPSEPPGSPARPAGGGHCGRQGTPDGWKKTESSSRCTGRRSRAVRPRRNRAAQRRTGQEPTGPAGRRSGPAPSPYEDPAHRTIRTPAPPPAAPMQHGANVPAPVGAEGQDP